jgi:repressor LexA
MDLTKRQQEIFDFIKRYSATNGYPPTVRDIGKAVGLASSSTVHAHLANLERIGLLRRDPTKPRAIELLDRAAAGVRGFVKPGLPLVGQVAAGQPVVAEENIEEYIQTPEFAGGADGEFLLRVRGESMIEAGILDGDLVIVQRAQDARNGEIVVALVGNDESADEATVKTFYRESDRIRLQPENATLAPIYADHVEILGRVVGVFREL